MRNNENDKNILFNVGNRYFESNDCTPTPHNREGDSYSATSWWLKNINEI